MERIRLHVDPRCPRCYQTSRRACRLEALGEVAGIRDALNGALPKRDHELLAMRASYNCRSEFEWANALDISGPASLDRLPG